MFRSLFITFSMCLNSYSIRNTIERDPIHCHVTQCGQRKTPVCLPASTVCSNAGEQKTHRCLPSLVHLPQEPLLCESVRWTDGREREEQFERYEEMWTWRDEGGEEKCVPSSLLLPAVTMVKFLIMVQLRTILWARSRRDLCWYLWLILPLNTMWTSLV